MNLFFSVIVNEMKQSPVGLNLAEIASLAFTMTIEINGYENAFIDRVAKYGTQILFQ